MNLGPRIVAVVVVLVAAICAVLLGVGVASSSTQDECGNQILSTVISPDGTNKLVMFGRDCGATTDFSTQISMLPTEGVLRNTAGNVFIATVNHGLAPFGPGGGPALTMAWENARSVVLAYDSRARVHKAVEQFGDVHIRYVP